jgi:hypothetical protein
MSLRRLGLALCVGLFAVAGPVLADEPVLLRFKFAKGDKLLYKNDQEMKQTQNILNMKVETTVSQDAVMSRVIDDVDSSGKATLKTKAERRKIKIDTVQGKYEFDSKSTERDTTSAIGGAVTPIFERLTGSEYEVFVSPRGEVTEVKGYAELIGDLLKDNPLGGQFTGAGGGNPGAKIAEQESLISLSDKPVKPGDQWETPFELELAGVGKIRGKVTYVYEANDKVGDLKTVRIGITSEVTVDLNIEAGGAKVTGSISTTSSTGTAQFDPVAGRLISSKRTVTMGGQLSVEAGGMIIPVDNQQEQTSTTTLLEKLPD